MRNLIYRYLCLITFCAANFCYSNSVVAQTKTGIVVKTEGGYVKGTLEHSGIIAFKGVPFAAPPVGNLRWKAPEPIAKWNGIKECATFGPSPMQAKPTPFMVYTPEFLIPEEPISEDCLYLNVWAKQSKSGKKPVFVWIYGGGFSSGGTAVPIYYGEALAKKGIVFVSINYRVGIFGFLAHPELSKESPDKASGNYGLLDQIAALKWVKKNIAAFGGDPDNITIGGQSAGSMSVNCLVASPLAKGLFKKAIAESGSLLYTNPLIPANTLQAAEEQGVKLQQSVNAASITDLRKLPAEQLMKFQGRFAPVVDGYVLPKSIADIFAAGKQNDVPLLTGWNADESFVTDFKKKDEYLKQVREQYSKDAAEYLKYYPAGTDEEAARSQVKISRDMIFANSGYKWATIQSAQNKAPVYVYYFARKLPATADYVKYGAFHTGEVAYVMDNLKFLNRPWQTRDRQLAQEMSTYWVNFMVSGNPNGSNLPPWPKYNSTTKQAIVFGDTKTTKQELPDWQELDFNVSRQ